MCVCRLPRLAFQYYSLCVSIVFLYHDASRQSAVLSWWVLLSFNVAAVCNLSIVQMFILCSWLATVFPPPTFFAGDLCVYYSSRGCVGLSTLFRLRGNRIFIFMCFLVRWGKPSVQGSTQRCSWNLDTSFISLTSKRIIHIYHSLKSQRAPKISMLPIHSIAACYRYCVFMLIFSPI